MQMQVLTIIHHPKWSQINNGIKIPLIQSKSTTQINNGIQTPLLQSKHNGTIPIIIYKHCIFKLLSSSRNPRSNINLQAVWADIHAVLVGVMFEFYKIEIADYN